MKSKNIEYNVGTEESLDPNDWEGMRRLGHEMLDGMMTYLQTVRQRPIWQKVPGEIKETFKKPLPVKPQAIKEIYNDFTQHMLPYPNGNIHPRFWGWVEGTGTPFGMLAEMLAGGANSHLAFGDHSAIYLELQVLNWLKEMLGYPMEAAGILTSGCSMANFIGLAVARTDRAGYDIRKHGVTEVGGKMRLYCSSETHNSVQKAVEMLGMGNEAMVYVPVNDDYRIDIEELKTAIVRDKAAGNRPFCIVANAGTVNTGAMDPVDELADICREEGLWLHVDGAFGVLAALDPGLKPLLKGVERADSLAFDLHKWMYMQYEVGCLLVKDKEAHQKAFHLQASYLVPHERGLSAGPVAFNDRGPELSKSFRGLKVWMSIKEHGIEKYGRLIRQNVDQARYLAKLIDESAYLERLAEVPLNIVCFRFFAKGLDDEALNKINKEIVMRIQEQGIAIPTYTVLKGKYAIRVAITNHRSKREDFDLLVSSVISNGQAVILEN